MSTSQPTGEPLQAKDHTTISRMIGFKLANGRYVESPVEVWFTALFQCLEPHQQQMICEQVERLNLRISVTPLRDGMALVHKPFLGLSGSS